MPSETVCFEDSMAIHSLTSQWQEIALFNTVLKVLNPLLNLILTVPRLEDWKTDAQGKGFQFQPPSTGTASPSEGAEIMAFKAVNLEDRRWPPQTKPKLPKQFPSVSFTAVSIIRPGGGQMMRNRRLDDFKLSNIVESKSCLT
jgi:hypothetical protein